MTQLLATTSPITHLTLTEFANHTVRRGDTRRQIRHLSHIFPILELPGEHFISLKICLITL